MSAEPRGGARESPWSVAALVGAISAALGDALGELWIEGEIFDYRGPHHSGHHYFGLRDAAASLPAIVWRGVAGRALRAELREGARVLVHGHLDVWPKTGKLSLLVDRVEERGAGDLARRFAELKQRLEAAGLFARERKRALPALPRRLLLITGKGSAAEADVLQTLRAARAPLRILLRHARVQGAGAAEELAAALAEAGAVRADLVLLARGGGSLEDLWAFNEELLVRAVAACAAPVISAVGHETDLTLCDFAADARAITPTHGAQLAAAGWTAARSRVDEAGRALGTAAAVLLDARRRRLDRAVRELLRQAPERRLERLRWATAELHRRLLDAGEQRLARARARLAAGARRMERRALAPRVALLRARLGALGGRLDAANPEALLARGWALVEARGRPGFLRRARDVAPGDALRIRLAEGEIGARVE